MNITDYYQTKNGLKQLYDAAEQELKSMRKWESFSAFVTHF